jgi:hypothetical protein
VLLIAIGVWPEPLLALGELAAEAITGTGMVGGAP